MQFSRYFRNPALHPIPENDTGSGSLTSLRSPAPRRVFSFFLFTGSPLCSTWNEPSDSSSGSLPRKEVIQPHLPIRLPCYDFTPVTGPAFGSSLLKGWVTDFGRYQLPWCDGRCVQDPGTYSPRHSDSRLLAIPASCSRVADYNPN